VSWVQFPQLIFPTSWFAVTKSQDSDFGEPKAFEEREPWMVSASELERIGASGVRGEGAGLQA
jgi:hypothetical protein